MRSNHTVHIPVMGTGFTIDSPIKVARFGINSVISLVDDILVEQMRKYHSERLGMPFQPIPNTDPDPRAHRITAFLNLQKTILDSQIERLRSEPFEPGREIVKYFEMLPDGELRRQYVAMTAMTDSSAKRAAEDALRLRIIPGTIDVNIMTKLDADEYRDGQKRPPEFSHASAALRGFALSDLDANIIISAGLNKRLFEYMTQFADFYPNADGHIRKRIVLKVSDLRSAQVQSKYLARKGLWVSEFRIESGLNCGGHAFAANGILLGPILEEFREKRKAMDDETCRTYFESLVKYGKAVPGRTPDVLVTAQGGIGTAEEDRFLIDYYKLDGTGWGTPFLLVPEAINLDADHIQRLINATDKDVDLSDSSPVGIPFWTLNTAESEVARKRRIADGKPGAPCPKGYLVSSTEFTERPICVASRAWQKKKLEKINADASLSADMKRRLTDKVVGKACICHDLAGGTTKPLGIDPNATACVCAGPNIVNFSKVATLAEMLDHIYGRRALPVRAGRDNMFINELEINVRQMEKELEESNAGVAVKPARYFTEYRDNLMNGIAYYRTNANAIAGQDADRFIAALDRISETVRRPATFV
ncbi:MAG: hypothetical protein ABIH86_05325 [Planctomycetota bacterium]